MINNILKNFVKIHTDTILLHKPIEPEDILLLNNNRYGNRYGGVFIFDRNDIPDNVNYLRALDLNRVPKTDYHLSTISVPYGWIWFPYATDKTFEVMNIDRSLVRESNDLLRKRHNIDSLHIFVKLESTDDQNIYNLVFYINKKIINKILSGSRDHSTYVFYDLAQNNAFNNLQSSCIEALHTLIEQSIKQFEYSSNPTDDLALLKPSTSLYKYQWNDISWMQDLENKVDNDENTIQYDYSNAMSLCNDEFTLINNTMLVPTKIINKSALKQTKRLAFYGGNIISEVGMGKTLITLYHILSSGWNDHIKNNNFLSFRTECNYMYKRGNNKSKHCTKGCVEGKLYCREHEKSIFMEKRGIVYKNLDQFNIQDYIQNDKFVTSSTLVMCPNQLCDQWVKEYYNNFDQKARILLLVTSDQFHNVTLADILFSDIVVVSYNFLTNKIYNNSRRVIDIQVEMNKIINQNDQNDITTLLNTTTLSKLQNFKWRRIVCDEAHELVHQHKIVLSDFESQYRWNITGTPLAHKMNGFLKLISFNTNDILTIDSFCRRDINLLTEEGINDKLVEKCSSIFKRNTKNSVKEELTSNIVKETIHYLDFTQQERAIYDSYKVGSKSNCASFLIKLCCHSELNQDTKDLVQNCKTLDEIQEVLLEYNKQKMTNLDNTRQTVSKEIEYYEDLVRIEEDQENNEVKIKLASLRRQYTIISQQYEETKRVHNYLESVIKSIDNTEQCAICLDDIDRLSITKCGHKYCWDCLYETYQAQKDFHQHGTVKCPSCNTLMRTNEIFVLTENQKIDINSDFEKLLQETRSTKVANIIQFLRNIKPTDKVILFSQWDELLHKVGGILNKQKVPLVYCTGSVYQKQKAIKQFKNDSKTNVIMLSSRHAASGINLTEANIIILLEPVYGTQKYREDIENQGIGRADRIGQKRPIEVHRFVIKDSIEQDILENKIDFSSIRTILN